ncbi:MAG TPA: hypothetical protein DDY73_08135 [Coprobacter fastidiosus]|uniref:Uncharacterized protein n=1 Tax=Coprobacter fastidiosus TaxID=1099853 RepID=A0A354M373_9BACT|nr:hypothetical protein [Coprobacter fastidiosus]
MAFNNIFVRPSAKNEIKCKVKIEESPKIPILFLYFFLISKCIIYFIDIQYIIHDVNNILQIIFTLSFGLSSCFHSDIPYYPPQNSKEIFKIYLSKI